MAKQLALLLFNLVLIISNSGFGQNIDYKNFVSGQKIKYFSKGHPKAKGLNVSIEYPNNWIRKEGERPNVVQNFIESASDGLARICVLLIKDQPDILKLFSSQELAELAFNTESLKEFIPPGAKFIKGAATKYDNQPGAWIIYVMNTQSSGYNVEMYTLQHTCIYSGKLIILQCSIGGIAESNNVKSELFSDYLPLFQLMGTSIVIHDKWTKDNSTEEIKSLMSEFYGENWLLTWIISAIFTWGIGLTPPILIRFLFLKRPISKGWAFGVITIFWIVNLIFFTALGSTSKTHGALLLVALASYAILRKGVRKQNETMSQTPSKSPTPIKNIPKEEFTDLENYQEIDDFSLDDKEKPKVYGAVLGLQGTVTKQEIIEAYKKLIAKYHPDKVSHLGKEFQLFAEKKTKDINKAFFYFKRRYNL